MIVQQMEALSLAELLELRAKVDALIYGKSSPSLAQLSQMSSQSNLIRGVGGNVLSGGISVYGIPGVVNNTSPVEIDNYVYMYYGHEANEEDNSLEQVIQLVDEWMADESGYDEEAFPQIEAALNQNQPPL